MFACCSQARLQPRKRVVFLGLDNSGKTTLFHQLIAQEPSSSSSSPYVPTKVPMIETTTLNNKRLVVWDIPGSNPHTWRHFFAGTSAIIFTINCEDTPERLHTAKQELEALAMDDQLRNCCILVVLTKHTTNQALLQDISTMLNTKFPQHETKACFSSDFQANVKWMCEKM